MTQKTAARESKQTAVEEKNKKIDTTDLFDFPAHDYTQEQNGSLRGRRLKGKGKGVLGKGVLGARKTRGTRGLAPKFPSPSLSNACHEG